MGRAQITVNNMWILFKVLYNKSILLIKINYYINCNPRNAVNSLIVIGCNYSGIGLQI